MSYLIIGNGPAGVSAIARIREIDPTGRIILISAEDNPPYSRMLTPEYMTGEVGEERLYYRGSDFYEKYQVETRLGAKVTKIIPSDKTVLLADGEKIAYARLLIAAGSRPLVPSWADNTGLKGVFTLWKKQDSEAINSHLRETGKAVIIGGGLVGLQCARALSTRGIKVTVIEKLPRLMPLQLDETASALLQQAAEQRGIEILLNTEVLSLEREGGRVTGVGTKEGIVPADLVLVAIGVKPNLEMAWETGLKMDRGLLTDERMQTNIPGIYAAGDVVQSTCLLSGQKTVRALWLCAVRQGKVAGANMAGVEEYYAGSVALNSIQLFGLSIISQGQLEPLAGQEELAEKILRYPQSGAYHKFLVQKGKLAGFILVGDVRQAGIYHHKLGEPLWEGYWGQTPAWEADEILV